MSQQQMDLTDLVEGIAQRCLYSLPAGMTAGWTIDTCSRFGPHIEAGINEAIRSALSDAREEIERLTSDLADAEQQLEVLRPGGTYAWKCRAETAEADVVRLKTELAEAQTKQRLDQQQCEDMTATAGKAVEALDKLRQQIAEIDPLDDEGVCAFCFGADEHKPTCLWQQTRQPKDGAEK